MKNPNKYIMALIAIVLTAWVAWPTQAQTLDRAVTVLGSEARTATTTGADWTNTSGNLNVSGAYIFLDVAGVSGSPTITMSVQAKDPVSGQYETVFSASAGVSATSATTYLIYPGVGAASNDVAQVVSRPLPPMWRVQVSHANANPITYSVGALLLD